MTCRNSNRKNISISGSPEAEPVLQSARIEKLHNPHLDGNYDKEELWNSSMTSSVVESLVS